MDLDQPHLDMIYQCELRAKALIRLLVVERYKLNITVLVVHVTYITILTRWSNIMLSMVERRGDEE